MQNEIKRKKPTVSLFTLCQLCREKEWYLMSQFIGKIVAMTSAKEKYKDFNFPEKKFFVDLLV